MPIFKLVSKTETGTATRYVTYCVDYRPYHRGFNGTSALVLDFKNGQVFALNYFVNLINSNFEHKWENCCCVAVPSSDARKTSTPVHDLIKQWVSLRPCLEDGSAVLVRSRSIPKLAKGGNRNMEVHLNSIRINRKCGIDVSGKNVLLVDDVITTGNSVLACASILKDAGARNVFILTMAKTV